MFLDEIRQFIDFLSFVLCICALCHTDIMYAATKSQLAIGDTTLVIPPHVLVMLTQKCLLFYSNNLF